MVVMNNIMHVPVEANVLIQRRIRSGRNRMVCPEQISIACMKDLVSKFSKPAQMEVNVCAGTYATGKA